MRLFGRIKTNYGAQGETRAFSNDLKLIMARKATRARFQMARKVNYDASNMFALCTAAVSSVKNLLYRQSNIFNYQIPFT